MSRQPHPLALPGRKNLRGPMHGKFAFGAGKLRSESVGTSQGPDFLERLVEKTGRHAVFPTRHESFINSHALFFGLLEKHIPSDVVRLIRPKVSPCPVGRSTRCVRWAEPFLQSCRLSLHAFRGLPKVLIVCGDDGSLIEHEVLWRKGHAVALRMVGLALRLALVERVG